MPAKSGRRLVIGLGNPDRGDDGAGRAVARALRARADSSFAVRECSGEATALMEAWAGSDEVVLVDASRGAGPPGSVHRFEANDLDRLASLRSARPASTHALGACLAVALSRALGTLPGRLAVYAIEGARFEPGQGLSPEVAGAVDAVAALLAREAPAPWEAAGPVPEVDRG